MSIRSALVSALTGKALHTETLGPHTHLIIQTHDKTAGQFRSISFSVAGTTALVTPPSGQAMFITDLIISAERVANGDVLIQFTDGSNTVPIIDPQVNDAPVDLAIGFVGRWRGWVDARIDVVATGTNISGNVALGYYFVGGDDALTFGDWDAQRD